MSKVKFKYGTAEQLANAPYLEGTFYVISDDNSTDGILYADLHGNRICFGDVASLVKKVSKLESSAQDTKIEVDWLRSNIIKNTLERDTTITADDVHTVPPQEIIIYGKSEQKGTPTPATPVSIDSLDNKFTLHVAKNGTTDYGDWPVTFDLGSYILRSLPDGTCDTLRMSYSKPSEDAGWAMYDTTLEQTIASIALTDLEWTQLSNGIFQGKNIPNSANGIIGTHQILCDTYQEIETQSNSADMIGNDDKTIAFQSDYPYIFVKDTDYTNLDDFIASLGTSVITYPLATPIVHSLETVEFLGTVELPILPNPMTAWIDDGNVQPDISMTYEVDNKIFSSNLIHAETDVSLDDIRDRINALGNIDEILTNRLTATEADIDSLEVTKANIDSLEAAEARIDELEVSSATIQNLEATNARIGDLETDSLRVKNRLTAAEADIGNLEAVNVNVIGRLRANEADIEELTASKATVDDLIAVNANIQELEAANATITGKLTAAEASIEDLEAENATITGTLTAAQASIEDLEATNATITGRLEANEASIEDLEATNATITGRLEANEADIDTLTASKADITDLNAATARIGSLETDNVDVKGRLSATEADIENLEATTATIESLNAEKARIDTLETDKANVTDLTAATGRIGTLEANTADINTIRANSAKVANLTAQELEADHATIGSLDANYAQINMANVNNAWIQNGTVKDGAISNAMINSVSANKLTAGTIDASNITVTNLNADNITTGTINGQRIGAGSLSLDKLEENVYTEDEVNSIVDNLQNQIDGTIETWTGTEIPTLSNTPASDWTTDSIKDRHIGDIYFVVNSQSEQNGYNYRFTKIGNTYSWQLIKDSDVTQVLQRLTDAEGKIGDIEQFDSTISSWKTDTDEELSSIKSAATTLAGRVTTAEGTLATKVDTTTFNTLSQTVDGNSSSIQQLTTETSTLTQTVDTLNTKTSSDSGNIIQFSDSIGFKEIVVHGKSVQTNYTGKNLFDDTDSAYYPKSGTTTNFYYAEFTSSLQPRTHLEAGKTYTLSMDVTSTSQPFSISVGLGNGSYSTDIGQANNLSNGRVSVTFSVTEAQIEQRGDILALRAPRYGDRRTFDWTISNIQLELGSTATDYESYVGGKPSPNPDYPQEIQSVDNLTLHVCGKNLFDRSGEESGYVWTDGEKYDASGWLVSSFIPVVAGVTYTLTPNTTAGGTAKGCFYDVNKTFIAGSAFNSGPITITVPDGAVYSRFSYRDTSTNVQLELGSIATDYEPYQGQSIDIPLGDHQIRSLPDGTDDTLTFSYIGPSIREGWGLYNTELEQKVGVTDLGTLNWLRYDDNHHTFYASISSIRRKSLGTLCTSYRWKNIGVDGLTDGEYSTSSGGNTYVWFRDDAYDDAALFKASVSGVIFDYILATPVTHSLGVVELPLSEDLNLWASTSPSTTIDATWWHAAGRDEKNEINISRTAVKLNETIDTVDEHARKISSLETTVETKADGSEITTINNKLNTVSDTVDGHTQSITSLNNTVATKADGSEVTTLNNKLNTVSDTVDGHTQSIASLNNTVATKADGSEVTTLNNKVNTISDTVDEHTQSISSLNTTMATKADSSSVEIVSDRINSISETVDGHTQSISSINSTVATKADSSTVTTLSNNVNSISETVDGHTQAISSLNTTVATKANGSELTTVSNKVNTISDTVDEHSQSISSINTTLDTKADGSALTTVSNKLNTVSDTVDGHTQSISSINETLETKVDSSTVSSLTTKVNNISDTVDGHTQTIGSVQNTQTQMQGKLNKTIVETTQLWYSKANTEAPAKPTSQITSTSTDGNAWRIVVPVYNASYPNYFYCYQWKYTDGTYGWSSVTRDIATGESQERARTAITDASSAVSTAASAQATAESASTNANQAKENASSAVSLANTASTNASSALSTANTASSNASTALSTANSAASDASSAVSTANTAKATADKNVKTSLQLWFTKANETAPNKPTARVTSTSTDGNAWRVVVPTYSVSYPYYFYCYQYELADGTYTWSDVVYDRATTENQSNSRNAVTGVSTLTTKTNTISDTVDQHSQSISSLNTTVATKADNSTVTTLSNNLSTLEQDVNTFKTTVSSTYSTKNELAEVQDDISDLQAGSKLSDTKSGNIISINDALAAPPISVEVYGVSTQAGTPTPNAPVPIESVDDLTLHVCGKNLYSGTDQTFTQNSGYINIAQIPAGTYTISAEVTSNDTDAATCGVLLRYTDYSTSPLGQVARGSRASVTISAAKPVNQIIFYASDSNDHAAGDTATWKNVQIQASTSSIAYEPYTAPTSISIPLSNHIARSLPDGTRDTVTLTYQGPSETAGYGVYSKTLVQRVWEVDLGTLTWSYTGGATYPRFAANLTNQAYPNPNAVANAVCTAYVAISQNDGYSGAKSMGFCINNSGIWVWDQSYTDVATFKAAMSGMKLIYQLATPITTDLGTVELPVNPSPDLTAWADGGSTQPNISIDYWLNNAADIVPHLLDLDAISKNNITAIESRVHTAESTIDQHSESIALKANGSDVYTKTQSDGLIATEVTNRNAAIATATDAIELSVSKTYASKKQLGSRNLVDTTTITSGYLAVNGGVQPAGATFKEFISDYIPVSSDKPMIFQYWVSVTGTGSGDGAGWMAYGFYDSNKSWLSSPGRFAKYSDLSSTSTTPVPWHDVYKIDDIPSGAAYIRVSWRELTDGIVKLERRDDSDANISHQVEEAKAAIKETTDSISTEVSKKVGTSEVISKINQSPESVKIQASKVEIDGAAIFMAISDDVDDAITDKGYQTASQVNTTITSKGYATTTQAQGYANAVNDALSNYISSNDTALQTLQNQVDGQIEAWYKTVDPTTSNEPASGWTTDALKQRHEGDLYYNVTSGHSWRWLKNDSTYSWQNIPDSDAAAALAAAQNAQTAANSKRRIFTTTPTVPYDVGDLWVSGSQVKYAKTAKASSQSYAAADWVVTATDDSNIPTNVSQLTNDANYGTTSQIATAKSEAISAAATDATNKANAVQTNLDAINPFVIGTQTAATYAWTGNCPELSELKDGQQITYFLPYSVGGSLITASYTTISSGAVTNVGGASLTLTLANNVSSGQIPIWYGSGMSRVTSHYAYGSVLHLTYREDVTMSGTYHIDRGWFADANYNTDTVYSRTLDGGFITGLNGAGSYSLHMKDANGNWTNVVKQYGTNNTHTVYTGGLKFDEVLYNSAWYTNGIVTTSGTSIGGTLWSSYLLDFRYSANVVNTDAGRVVARNPVYLVGTVGSDGLLYLDTTKWWTQTLPTSADGKLYLYIGTGYDWYRINLQDKKEAYIYHDGKVKEWSTYLSDKAQATANAAAPKTAAVSEEQYIYRSAASGTTSMAGMTTWVTIATDTQNAWTTKRPTYSSFYPVLFVAKQRKTVSGTITCTTPVKDDTTTVIDGGHITTGTIDTNRLNADTIKSNIVQTTDLNADKITSGTIGADRIKANVISAVNNGTGTINADKINVSGLTIGYSQVTNTPTIPTKVSDLSNDSGFQTSTQVDNAITSKGYQTSSQVNTAIESKGYATTEQAQGYANAKDSAIAAAARRTDVSIAVTAINYTNNTATLQATLYIDGTATTSGVTYKWLKDGAVISGQTSRTLSVTSAMGLSHVYSCTVTYS